MASVLVVDDLPAVHEMLEAVINPCGFLAAFALSGEEALKRYREGNIDVVLVDIEMEPMDGITVLKELKEIDPNAIVIMMTGYSSTETATQAIKYGAFDYVQKPFRLEELVKTLHRGMDARKSEGGPRRVVASDEPLRAEGTVVGALLGKSEAIKAVDRQVQKLLRAKTPMLIQGEIGTGKRSLAELVHEKASGRNAPFKGVDCSLANPEELKRAIVGGNGIPGSLFLEAEGGTLFLNGVDRMPVELQGTLAKALQVTGSQFRLICATDCDLESRLEKGKVSNDFYYRVATLPITLPPLRERKEDLGLLIKDFLKRSPNPYFDTTQIEFSREAEDILYAYPWPGNLIELANVLSGIVVAAKVRLIGPQQIPHRIKSAHRWPNLKEFLHAREEAYLEEVLRFCDDDKERASEIAGVKNIFESEAVAEAKEQLSEAEGEGDDEMSPEAMEAVEKLKEELEVQENAVNESKAMIKEREEFLEMSENTLFDKVMAQQERETVLEQISSDLDKRERELEVREKAVAANG